VRSHVRKRRAAVPRIKRGGARRVISARSGRGGVAAAPTPSAARLAPSGPTFAPGSSFSIRPETILLGEVSPLIEIVEIGPMAVMERFATVLEAASSVPSLPLPRNSQERLALYCLNGERTKPIPLSVKTDGSVVCVSSDDFGISGLGPSYFQAVEDLADQVDLLARHYLNTPDSKLTESGRRLKVALSRFFPP
jgi:hypothetical protein